LIDRPKKLAFDTYRRAFDSTMRSGIIVNIPASCIAEFRTATPAQLAKAKLYPSGSAIEQRDLDVDISVPGLLRDIFGFEVQQRRAAQVKTEARAAAARANGAKGGRPRKETAYVAGDDGKLALVTARRKS
jgi:Protein of unknown function (DUF2442)